GTHDPDYVDAYYGPPELKTTMPLDAISETAKRLLLELREIEPQELLRHRYLSGQLASLAARVEMLRGKKMTFDEEAAALYDARPPTFSEDHFKSMLNELGSLLPGAGGVSERFDRFKKGFIIPKEKLDAVFQSAITECRKRTKERIELI